MAAITPRRSTRVPHTHTPKMSERKKSLFQSELEASRESLTKHRRLPVVDSESDSEDCDLGIISTLDSSSGEENEPIVIKTPERRLGSKYAFFLIQFIVYKYIESQSKLNKRLDVNMIYFNTCSFPVGYRFQGLPVALNTHSFPYKQHKF